MMNYANRVIQLPLGLRYRHLPGGPAPAEVRFRRRGGVSGDNARLPAFCTFRDPSRDPGQRPHLKGSDPPSVCQGAFGQWAWEGTARSLAMYSPGLPGMACSTVVNAGLYARSLPRAALKVTFSSVAATLLFLPRPDGADVMLRDLPWPCLFHLRSQVRLGFTFWPATWVSGLGSSLSSGAPKWSSLFSATAGTVLAFTSMMPYPAGEGIAFRSFWVFAAVFFSSSLVYGVFTWFSSPGMEMDPGAVAERNGSSGIKGEGEE